MSGHIGHPVGHYDRQVTLREEIFAELIFVEFIFAFLPIIRKNKFRNSQQISFIRENKFREIR